ncbi:MAG: methionyl-tRNA formyltransferase [Candidatus Levyibacteriota bacterium]
MNVVFFGGSKYTIPIVKLLNSKFNLSLVITAEKEINDPIIKYCLKNQILYYSVNSFSSSEIKQKLLTVNPNFAVLANFRFIIPKEILDIFPKGVVNIHPSYLPKYRGPTPVQTAILNGNKKTGVTLIKLDEKIDHGEIIAQKEEEILKNDTSESLYLRLFKQGSEMLNNTITKYLEGKYALKKQNDLEASFTKILKRDDGYIDFSKIPSQTSLNKIIRAYFPWPGTWIKVKINNKDLRIKLLPNNMLQVEGKKPLSFKDFINGYPEAKDILEKLSLS